MWTVLMQTGQWGHILMISTWKEEVSLDVRLDF